MDGNDNEKRLEMEMSLLEAMYPTETMFHRKTKEVIYVSDSGSLHLRIPEGYPSSEAPEIISANDAHKVDLRDKMKQKIQSLPFGEEALDAVIAEFHALATYLQADTQKASVPSNAEGETIKKICSFEGQGEAKKTTVIWLHHLVNTSKRKQVLAPSVSDISGVSKPGYPGVLIFSGSARVVNDHVNELRQLNWQAFQIRLEEPQEWRFAHERGVIEVESMKDVVKQISDDKKNHFLEAMRMR